jgi:peptidoglycan/LPS O-acetylase OafA/YrhL
MGLEALSLAVFSTLHLSGAIHGSSTTGSSSDAAVPEAVICVVLAAGAVRFARPRWRRAALAATGFAILGFVVGLTSTLNSGPAIDLAYHLTVLPLLVATLFAVLATPHDE